MKGEFEIMPADSGSEPLLEARNLHMQFPIRRGAFRRTVGFVKAVNDVSFHIRQGETLSLVGESGCGKTTTGRCIARVYEPTSGQILYKAEEQDRIDLAELNNRDLRPFRREIRMIFQDPFSSLNPRLSILQIVELAATEDLFANPLHPYTEALLSAVPKPDPRLRNKGVRIRLEGEVADPSNPPSGCYFQPRCPYAEDRCRHEEPAVREIEKDRWVACHFAEELDLRGFEAIGQAMKR